jgi:hypothetical protein
VAFGVPMRGAPTCTFTDTVTAINFPALPFSFTEVQADHLHVERTPSATGGGYFMCSYTASAEL